MLATAFWKQYLPNIPLAVNSSFPEKQNKTKLCAARQALLFKKQFPNVFVPLLTQKRGVTAHQGCRVHEPQKSSSFWGITEVELEGSLKNLTWSVSCPRAKSTLPEPLRIKTHSSWPLQQWLFLPRKLSTRLIYNCLTAWIIHHRQRRNSWNIFSCSIHSGLFGSSPFCSKLWPMHGSPDFLL